MTPDSLLARLRRPGLGFKVSALVVGVALVTVAGSALILLSNQRRQAERELEIRTPKVVSP